jgi:hypothetical protein
MTNRPSTTPPFARTASAAPVEASVFELAEGREREAPPEAIRQIAGWVNEGGAGGEVKR